MSYIHYVFLVPKVSLNFFKNKIYIKTAFSLKKLRFFFYFVLVFFATHRGVQGLILGVTGNQRVCRGSNLDQLRIRRTTSCLLYYEFAPRYLVNFFPGIATFPHISEKYKYMWGSYTSNCQCLPGVTLLARLLTEALLFFVVRTRTWLHGQQIYQTHRERCQAQAHCPWDTGDLNLRTYAKHSQLRCSPRRAFIIFNLQVLFLLSHTVLHYLSMISTEKRIPQE